MVGRMIQSKKKKDTLPIIALESDTLGNNDYGFIIKYFISKKTPRECYFLSKDYVLGIILGAYCLNL
jgi:hypothetical protein